MHKTPSDGLRALPKTLRERGAAVAEGADPPWRERAHAAFDWAGYDAQAAITEALSYAADLIDAALAEPPAPSKCVQCGGPMVPALLCAKCGETEAHGPSLAAVERESPETAPADVVEQVAAVMWHARWKAVRDGLAREGITTGEHGDWSALLEEPEAEIVVESFRAQARAAIALLGGHALQVRALAERWRSEVRRRGLLPPEAAMLDDCATELLAIRIGPLQVGGEADG